MDLLFIGNDKNWVNTIKFHLKKNYFITSCSADSKNEFQSFQYSDFDVVVLDYSILNKDSKNLLMEMRKISPDLIIILIVEFEDIDTVIDSCTKYIDDYIHKPVNAEQLVFWIERLNTKKELVKENSSMQKKIESEIKI